MAPYLPHFNVYGLNVKPNLRYSEIKDLLPFVYHKSINSTIAKQLKKYDWVSMDDVAKRTFPSYYLMGCTYIGENCKRNWTMVMTMYGYCLQFTPWRPLTRKTTIGRQYYLSVSIGTNETDWYTGWRSYMEGFTVFYRYLKKVSVETRRLTNYHVAKRHGRKKCGTTFRRSNTGII